MTVVFDTIWALGLRSVSIVEQNIENDYFLC